MPERTKGTACKAVKSRVQIPPGARLFLKHGLVRFCLLVGCEVGMSEEEKKSEDAGDASTSSFPHTPPMGIKAVRPGDDPTQNVLEDEVVPTVRERPVGNLLNAFVISVGVVLSIVGTFLPWVSIREGQYQSNEIGWDQGSSVWIVLIIGVLAAGLSSRVLNANNSSWEKLTFIVFGAVLLLVASLKISEVNNYDAVMGIEKSVGVGLPFIIAGGVLMILPNILRKEIFKFK